METSTPPLVEPLAARDGCDCPPWVIRCVHFGADGVVMAGQHDNAHDTHSGGVDSYSVYPMSAWVACPLCGDLATYLYSAIYHGRDYDEALAAFYAAEEALIRGAS